MTSERQDTSEGTNSARRTKHDLVAGRIVRPHGVGGAVVLEPVSDLVNRVEPGMKVYLGERRTAKTVVRLSPHGRRYLLELKGTTSREEAEELRSAEVRVRLEDVGPMPPNTFFRWQIIGLKVQEEDETPLGTVVDILETGANDVYEVDREGGKPLLLPAIDSVIRRIDLEAGTVTVRLLPGLDDAKGGGPP